MSALTSTECQIIYLAYVQLNDVVITNQDVDCTDSFAIMVNTFNDYFASVFTKDDVSHLSLLHQLTTVKCSDVQFTASDVYNKLLESRPGKAAGPYNLSPRLLLEVIDYIA